MTKERPTKKKNLWFPLKSFMATDNLLSSMLLLLI